MSSYEKLCVILTSVRLLVLLCELYVKFVECYLALRKINYCVVFIKILQKGLDW